MPAHDEDNHNPGIARALFCPVEPEYRHACECRITETLVVEPDGYEWSNDETKPCRGCELETLTGLPCTLHSLPSDQEVSHAPPSCADPPRITSEGTA